MQDAIKRLMGSSKAIVMLGLTAIVFAGVWSKQVTFDQAVHFLMYTAPAWLLSVGLEDAASKHGQATVEAAKLSMRPPPPPPPSEESAGGSQ